MTDHAERIAAARSAIDYICGRTDQEQATPVPNCPGWTVYNAASHIGRVGIAWEEMITSAPEDPESRARGYERAGLKPAGTSAAELAAWAHSAIDQLTDDLERRCYFSMTGGEGDPELWAWHSASGTSRALRPVHLEAGVQPRYVAGVGAAVDRLSDEERCVRHQGHAEGLYAVLDVFAE
ncbi:maleylpyruvate isomerase N-terminal domain-containing protein [Candidatus Poriferisodalis sp.]|uniref:maleylpyruvate isomerase N-terminal domain-containing protein n=1 Tax=Candidatus Poriferisodalis sp. TaxID=3101277 RepID=UPI003B01D8AB